MDDLTAYHESGHAVAATLQGGKVIRITIEPEEDERYGDTVVAWPMDSVDQREHAVREIHTLLAGPITERIYAGDVDVFNVTDESSEDWLKAVQFARLVFSQESKQSKLLAKAAREVFELVQSSKAWSAIAALADELEAHQTLEEVDVENVLGFWLSR